MSCGFKRVNRETERKLSYQNINLFFFWGGEGLFLSIVFGHVSLGYRLSLVFDTTGGKGSGSSLGFEIKTQKRCILITQRALSLLLGRHLFSGSFIHDYARSAMFSGS